MTDLAANPISFLSACCCRLSIASELLPLFELERSLLVVGRIVKRVPCSDRLYVKLESNEHNFVMLRV